MPIYDYWCPDCREVREHVVAYARRDNPGVRCPHCNMPSFWTGSVGLPNVGKSHQMGVTLSNGQHVTGHFGKEAARRRKRA